MNPKLTLTKTGTPASNLKAGDTVTYTYTVTNTGNVTVTEITVVDDTVTGITCPAAQPGNLAQADLAPGESLACTGTYTVTQQDVKKGQIVNTAQAQGDYEDQVVPSNEATFTVTTKGKKKVVQVGLSIGKKARVESDCRNTCQGEGFAAKGDRIIYTYRVYNSGTVAVTNVTVNDPTAGQVVCNTTTLAPGTFTDCHAVTPYVVGWADTKEGKVTNTAYASGTYGPQTVVSDPAVVTICITQGKSDHRTPGKGQENDDTRTAPRDCKTNETEPFV
ncbi:hypothetical protein QTQ03_30030 [Micromonospora sp. WMMA1363]|uniref:DUF7507 domain-containing protein n=1 Tax=Micromonospora sp. WMMA1363 TaxID=3053985 RepID=UPI00259D2BC5|nr:hypothetical protein [Micromonospora sp. WMMA1363]MDM4723444.1 hypothetical protein [Micromonospora sp. WMMA1363]MDM4723600.1 hypothetical protein [Micromonospora sp. WMMA1363]